jgi:hypothetical protein
VDTDARLFNTRAPHLVVEVNKFNRPEDRYGMHTRLIHASCASEAVGKLRKIIANESDESFTFVEHNVLRVKRSFWQRLRNEEPKWQVVYAIEPRDQSATTLLVPASPIANFRSLIEGPAGEFELGAVQASLPVQSEGPVQETMKALVPIFDEDSIDESVEETVQKVIHASVVPSGNECFDGDNLKLKPRNVDQAKGVGLRRWLRQWVSRTNSKEKLPNVLAPSKTPELAVNSKRDMQTIEKHLVDGNLPELMKESTQENVKNSGQDLSGSEKWVSLTETVFSDFDPKRS